MSLEFVDKAWGKTALVVASPYFQQHRLYANAGGYCSLHYHCDRANRFVVLRGTIVVVSWYGLRPRVDVLWQDNVLDVPSLVPHLFGCAEDAELIEEYWPDRGGLVESDDIVRLVHGGALNLGAADYPVAAIVRQAERMAQEVFSREWP